MNVLHLYRTYFPDTQGGLEEVIRQLCASTSALGANCRVLTTSPSPHPQAIQRPECQVFQNKCDFEIASCNVSLSAIRNFKEHAKWADVVHYHYPWPFADLLHFCANHKKPTVVTYHSDIVRQRVLGMLYRPLMRSFLNATNRIVCTSPNYFATSDVLSQFAQKVEVIPIGIEREEFCAGSPDIDELGSDYFLFVGVMRYYKGLHILLDAAKDAPYKIVLVGTGPIEADLRAQADKAGLKNVVFTGRIDDATKHALYRQARAVVFPSYLRSEAFGVTLVEGAMHGVPLISTEIGSGTSHVNIHNETGLVVPPSSHVGLRRAMDRLWFNPAEAKTMGDAAKRRYEKSFTANIMGERYFSLYNEIV
ncbi:MAG: glycosyltransferase [Pseudomonadales bacterium]|nr:glycosyltransferase [Pseudomonadales bacterium]